MTTNKPEVVGYANAEQLRHFQAWGGRLPRIMEEAAPTRVPLIRLSDYEARMAVLFDGHAVYSAMTDKAKQHTSPESVAAVLDAVVKLMREVTHG